MQIVKKKQQGSNIEWDSPKVDKSKNGYGKNWTKEECLKPVSVKVDE
jgi:hypothetical protein